MEILTQQIKATYFSAPRNAMSHTTDRSYRKGVSAAQARHPQLNRTRTCTFTRIMSQPPQGGVKTKVALWRSNEKKGFCLEVRPPSSPSVQSDRNASNYFKNKPTGCLVQMVEAPSESEYTVAAHARIAHTTTDKPKGDAAEHATSRLAVTARHRFSMLYVTPNIHQKNQRRGGCGAYDPVDTSSSIIGFSAKPHLSSK